MADFRVDTVIIGAGVVGLAIAYQLSKRNKEVLILESVVHHQTGLEGTEDEIDRYMFVFEGRYSYTLYSLFFDNVSKESYLTEHISFNKLKFKEENHQTSFRTSLGKCEIE